MERVSGGWEIYKECLLGSIVVCGIIKDLLERWKCEADLQAIKEMIQQGTHVEIIEGDVDIIFLAWLQRSMGLNVEKKKLDKSHCIKNNVKKLFDLRNKKEVNITNQVIQHLHKCINYIFSKNIGDVDGMRGELWEIQSPKLAIQNPTQWRVPSRKIECAVCTNYRKVGFVYWPRLVPLCSMPKNTCNLERAKAFIFRIQATATTYTVTWK